MTKSLTIIDDYPLTTYISNYALQFLNELHKHKIFIKVKNTHTYNKIDLKFISINQDLYQCKLFISISSPPLSIKEHL